MGIWGKERTKNGISDIQRKILDFFNKVSSRFRVWTEDGPPAPYMASSKGRNPWQEMTKETEVP